MIAKLTGTILDVRTQHIVLDVHGVGYLIAVRTTSGSHFWWSNRGDNTHTFLERTIDLTSARSPILTFRLWYDLEEGWDYAYLRASADGGTTWMLLAGEQACQADPRGRSYGPGYTGRSGGGDASVWVTESVDLRPLAGRSAMLRLDVVTDDSVNGNGLCLDDPAIPEIGWQDDIESGVSGWHSEGFVRAGEALAQEFIVQLVTWGEDVAVQRLEVAPDGTGTWKVPSWGTQVERALLAVTALAPSTSAQAPYVLTFEELP